MAKVLNYDIVVSEFDFHINFRGLFKAKAILGEEQLSYYLTHS